MSKVLIEEESSSIERAVGASSLVEHYGTYQETERGASRYHPLANYRVNQTDPDATPCVPLARTSHIVAITCTMSSMEEKRG